MMLSCFLVMLVSSFGTQNNAITAQGSKVTATNLDSTSKMADQYPVSLWQDQNICVKSAT